MSGRRGLFFESVSTTQVSVHSFDTISFGKSWLSPTLPDFYSSNELVELVTNRIVLLIENVFCSEPTCKVEVKVKMN